jgi:hypothetical protein
MEPNVNMFLGREEKMYFRKICSEGVRFKWLEILENSGGSGEPTGYTPTNF